MYKSIVVIIGMPRSGTSWLGQIVDSSPRVRFRLSPLFSYAFKNAVNEHSGREEYERVFRGAYESNEAFMSRVEERNAGHYPVFEDKDEQPDFLAIKMTRFHNLITRMVQLFDNLKMVAIVRHPCGAIHSWLSTPKEFPRDADPMEEWCNGACRKRGPEEFWGFEDWKKVTRLHMKLEQDFQNRFRILQYESLIEHPIRETQKLFDFLGLGYTEQTGRFLKDSHQKHDEDPYAVFKNPAVKDKWRTALHADIQEEIIRSIQNTELERFLS